MGYQLQYVNDGDIITAQRQNDITDYIELAKNKVNTRSVDVRDEEVINYYRFWKGQPIEIIKGGTNATTQQGAINNLLPSQTGNASRFLTTDGTNVSWGFVSSNSDGKVSISNFDTTTNYLISKLLSGNGISLLKENHAGNEILRIINTAPDQTVVLNAGSNISITGTYPEFTINSVGGGTTTFTGLTDTPNSYVGNAGKAVYVNGTENALIFQDAVSSDERVKYNVNDASAGYLEDKTIAGTGITLGENSDKLQITNSDTGSAAVTTHETTYDHDLIATALQSETDPVFTASQAFNIDATDITNLGNLSGVNTGDQDLSGYAQLSGAIFTGDISATNLSGTNTGDQTLPTRDSLGLDTDDTVTFANLSGTNTGDQDLSGLVPYTGATSDVNLGAYDLTATDIKSNYLNVQQGLGTALKVGADLNAQTLTNNTRKFGRIAYPHYDTSEEDVALFTVDSTGTTNVVGFGGGSNQLNTATDLVFYTAGNDKTIIGTNRLKIDNTGLATFSNAIDVAGTGLVRGNMRIGATSSAQDIPLDIQHQTGSTFKRMIKAYAFNGGLNNGGYIEFPTSSIDGYGPQIGALRTGSGNGDFIIRTGLNSQAERFRVTDGGLIGIGVTPTQKFHVIETASASNRDIVALFNRTGASQCRLVLKENSNTSTDSRLTGVQFSSSSSNASFVNYEGGEWVWWTNPTAGSATRRFRILNTGEVIVGDETGTPSNLFSVKGNASIGASYIGNSAPTNGLLIQGNVSIGQTTNSEALDVNGTIKGTGYKSSDGTAGATGTIDLTSATSIEVKNGLITAWS